MTYYNKLLYISPMQTITLGKYTAIKHGGRGLVVHLPQSFVKVNHLKPGSPVNLSIVDGDVRYLILEVEREKEAVE